LPSLYNHAFWLTRNHAEAEDLVQETFSKALRAFDSFQADANFKGWTFRILCNTFFTSRTGIAASRTVFLEDHQHALDTTDTSPTPEDNPIRLDNQAGLQRALEQLEPQLREALLLCDVEEVKYRDIALILDIPIGTVMSRISRARLPLRQLLQLQLGECSSCLPGTAKLARDANFPRLLVSLKTLDKGNASANCGKWAKERFALRQTGPALNG
jgi:RNA polymerase sigma-70 factor, ECF subfamily